ncbi:unnamed protein product [Closterium sp. NIES-54]
MAVDGGNSDDEELDGLMSRGVLRGPTRFSTASIGGVHERVHRAAASRERANVGRRSVAGGGNAEEYDSDAMPGVTPIGSMTRDEGIAPNYGFFKFTPDKIVVPRPLKGRHDLSAWVESIEPQLEIAQLKRFIDGTTPAPPAHAVALVTQFRAMQLLTFTTISRCCSPTVQIALKTCRMKVDAGFQAWQFIMRTYMAKDDLYISQLEQALTNLEMGEHESATSYCNRAQHILVNLRMAGVDYSQASYITHVVKGLPQQYNLLRRMLKLPQVRKELDEDTLASYIIEEECTLAAEGRKDQFLPQANQVFTKKGKPYFQPNASPSPPTTAEQQQPKHGGGVSEGGEKWKGAKDGQSKGGKGGFKRNCYVCGQPGHIAKYCRQWADKEADKGGEGSGGSSASGKGGDGSKGSGQSSCAMVKPVIEHPPPVMLEPKAREGLQAVAAAVKANPSVVLLDSGCSHHLMGDRSAFVEMSSSGSIKHVIGFNGTPQEVQGRGTVALLGDGGRRLRDSDVQLLDAGDVTLLRVPDGSLLGRAEFKGRVLCTNFQPCLTQQQEGETVALRTLATGVRSKVDTWHARLAHVGVDAIERTVAHGSVTSLELEKGGKSGMPCVSCVGGMITRHTFPSVGEEEDELLGVVHADLCGPFCEAAKDGSRYFLVLKDRKTRYVWAYPLAKKSDALAAFQKWLPMAERQCKTTVKAPRTDRGGEFLGHDFTLFLDEKGIIHDLTCPYTSEQNGMVEREMRSIVEAVRTMLLHMGVQHHWWHLALSLVIWVRNRVEHASLPFGVTPYELAFRHKLDASMVRVWGCMLQYMVPQSQRGGKLAPKARWGLHLGVSAASKGWQVLDLESNCLITTVEAMPYEPLPSLFSGTLEEEVEEEEVVAPLAMPYVPTSVPTPPPTVYHRVVPPTAPPPSSPPLATPPHPVISSPLPPSILPAPAPPSSSSSTAPPVGEGGTVVSLSVMITDGQRRVTKQLQDENSMDGVQQSGEHETGEQQTGEQQIGQQHIGEEQIGEEQIGEQQTGEEQIGEEQIGEQQPREPQTGEQEMWGIRDGGRVLVSGTITAPLLRRSTRITRGVPPVTYAWAVVIEPAGLNDEEEDEEWTDLDPDVVADPERQRDIAKMTVKEALGCWKGDKVKEAMDEEMQSLIEQGTWELVPRPPGVNVMKNRWILNTKFRPDGIVEREKVRLVVKGFTQVAGVDYEETYAPVGSYVTARVLLAIAAALDLDLVQLDVKNAFLHGELDRDLYMEQPSYYEDGSPRVCKLVKSLYGLKQSPMLWYEALDGVLLGAGWKKSQVDEALYFKSDAEGEMCWLLVYVDDLLAASRSQSMLGELRDLLQSAFQLREISPVEKYLGLQLVRDRPTRRLWLHQGAYVDKVHRRFFDGEQPLRVPRTPLSSDPFSVQTFEDVGWQSRQEEEYRQKVGSLQFAARTTRPDISFACSKLGSGQTVRSDQHWKELDQCLAYLVGRRDVALEFGGGPNSLELVGYADANDAGDKQNRTSTGGYVFVLGGAAVSWASQRIRCATLSSTESEYVAAVEAGKEARRLRFLLAEFQLLRSEELTTLFVDNSSAISVAGGLGLKGSLKHMEHLLV